MQCLKCMNKKVAIPRMMDSISPCFEASSCFDIIVITNSKVESTQQVTSTDSEGHKKIHLLQLHRVDVLICNGIKDLYQNMLTASGIEVIKNISDKIDNVVKHYLSGELIAEPISNDDLCGIGRISHSDLVSWATKVFMDNGYTVITTPANNDQMIDLIAEIQCPVCKKQVRIAVCCGSHTYRPSQEITEFHHATSTGYNALVYVCPGNPAIEECCSQYGIELLDPNSERKIKYKYNDKLPLLKGPVRDHEKASYSE